jgi:hypothetical protein
LKENDLFDRLQNCQNESRRRASEYVPEETTEQDGSIDFDADMLEFEDGNTTCGESGGWYIEGHGTGYMEFAGQLWKVLPRGLGGGDGRAFYPYVLCAGSVTIAFRKKRSETVSNVWVEFGSIPLAQHGGLASLWDSLKADFSTEGIQIERDILSRVDMFADFDIAEVELFCKRLENGSRVTRARSMGFYSEELNTALYLSGKKYTGFSLGKNIKVRCYDKRRELENDPIKWAVFADVYDGIPDTLTRVEFQLRRAALAEFEFGKGERIDGVESFLKIREKLWRYLTEDWFRLTESPVDAKNNNQAHAEVWSVWRMVQNAVVAVVKDIVRRKRDLDIDFQHLAKMALGCITKIAVWNDSVDSWRDMTGEFMRYVKEIGMSSVRKSIEKHYEEMQLICT